MRAIANEINILISCGTFQVTPSFRNYCTHAGLFDSVEDRFDESIRIIDDNASEANVDRWCTSLQKNIEILWRVVRRHVTEEKPAYIFMWQSVATH